MHLITTPTDCQKFRRFRLCHKLLLYQGMGCLFNKQTNQPTPNIQQQQRLLCTLRQNEKLSSLAAFLHLHLPTTSTSPIPDHLVPSSQVVSQLRVYAYYLRIYFPLSVCSLSVVGFTCSKDENTFPGSEYFYHQTTSSFEFWDLLQGDDCKKKKNNIQRILAMLTT